MKTVYQCRDCRYYTAQEAPLHQCPHCGSRDLRKDD